jgi:hypothetical protein
MAIPRTHGHPESAVPPTSPPYGYRTCRKIRQYPTGARPFADRLMMTTKKDPIRGALDLRKGNRRDLSDVSNEQYSWWT